ncbi:MAG: hypothetical protein M3Z06_04700 [Actinomycetota bacterium]|nr:hypothetical protein [Actinomycetota bacterium]
MKKLGLLLAVSAMLIATSPAFASSPPAGNACKATKAQRQIGLRVHKLSCTSAYRSLTTGAARAYRCRPVGQTRMIPYTIKCVGRRHKSTYYAYLFYGG